MHKENAAKEGRTVAVTVTTATDELHGWVSPGISYDDEFLLHDSDNGEVLRVKGWLAEVNPDEA